MDFKLKTIGSFVSSGTMIYPFDLQSSEDILIHRRKTSCEVLSLMNHQNSMPTKFQLSSSTTSKPKDFIQLNINKMKIFDSANIKEKNYLMLDEYLLPDCTRKNTHYLKCDISPFSERTGYILACLTTAGIIELYNYNVDACELEKIDINLLDLRRNALKNYQKEITKFDVLISTFNEIAFINFEWCAIPFEDSKLLLCVTKSDELIFYNIQENCVVESKSMKIENLSKNKLKWMDMNDKHYLLISTLKGDLVRYSVEFGDDEAVENIQKVDVIQGKVKMPISFISIDYHETSTIVFCCKGHSLEIFQMKGDDVKLACSQYIDITITGIEICDNLEYLISTLNSKVYYIQLAVANGTILLTKFEPLEFATSEDPESTPNCHAFYGIASSKNNVLVFLSCYPKHAYDHLVNKQPSHISINLFTKYDPLPILMKNPTLKLTDYVDCVEAIRYIGLNKFEMLQVLELMDYDISISREFLYYLKIQLLVINVKLVYYQMKSRNIFDIIKETKDLIRELILVINGYILLKSILESNTWTEMHFTVLRSYSKLIRTYCNTSVDKEPFRTALEILKPQLLEFLKVCDAKLKTKVLPPEICLYCKEAIADDQLECALNHKLKRCIVTNLFVPISCNNYCRFCRESVSPLETLSLIADDKSVNILLCPLCDLKLVLNE